MQAHKRSRKIVTQKVSHINFITIYRHVVLSGQPPPPQQVNYGGYGVPLGPAPGTPTQQYYSPHPAQMAYVTPQQPYAVSPAPPPRAAYVQDPQYAPQQPQPPPPPPQQWSQHQQQFYR